MIRKSPPARRADPPTRPLGGSAQGCPIYPRSTDFVASSGFQAVVDMSASSGSWRKAIGVIEFKGVQYPKSVILYAVFRPMIGVSEHAWNAAQERLGKQIATAALALVFEKHCAGEVALPGGYLRGMVEKAGAGELHLERSFHGRLSSQAA